MERLSQAHQAEDLLTGLPPEWTLYREVTAGSDGLPFGAQRLVEVRGACSLHVNAKRGTTFALYEFE